MSWLTNFVSSYRIYLIIAAAFALLSGGSLIYFKWSQDKFQELAAQNAELKVANDGLKAANDALAAQMKKIKEETDKLNKSLADIRTKAKKASTTIIDRNNDGKTAAEVEKNANEETKQILRDIQELTNAN